MPLTSPEGQEPGQKPIELVHRAHAAFRDVYPLISIIQGVCFTFLAEQALTTVPRPGYTQWVGYIACFVVLVAVWQEYMVGSTMFSWTPTMLDSLFPFVLGLVEFILISTVRSGTGPFLLGFAAFLLAGVVGYSNWLFHARSPRANALNRLSYSYLRPYITFGLTTCAVTLPVVTAVAASRSLVAWPSDAMCLWIILLTALPILFHSIKHWTAVLHRIQHSRLVN